MNVLLVGILAYVALQLLIGVVVSRRIRSESDYLLAGRSLGWPLATFSIFATWFGAETCIGAAGEVYDGGLAGGSADPFGYAFCILFLALVFAAPLWRRKLFTLADLFRERFSGGVERTAAVLMVPTSMFWAGAQVRAFGQVLATTSDAVAVEAGIAIAAGIVIFYTVFGGMLADAITDVVQGVALIVGLVVLLVSVTGELGGVPAALEAVDAERLSLVPPGSSWLDTIEAWSYPILGSVVAQELIARTLASRSAHVARGSACLAAGVYLAVGLIPVFLGLVGPALLPGLEHSEQLLPALAQRHLGPFLYVVFAGALVSAILSTVDSSLLVSSSLLSHNVVASFLPRLDDRSRLKLARAGVVLLGLVAYGLAHTAEDVHGLVALASSFGSSGLFVCLLFGLFTRVGGAASAYASLCAGVGAYTAAAFVYESDWPFVVSVGASLAAYLSFAVLPGRVRGGRAKP